MILESAGVYKHPAPNGARQTSPKVLAALPPDVRKGSAFPDRFSSNSCTKARLSLVLVLSHGSCATEGRRPSAHQAAEPCAQVWRAT